MQLFAGLRRNIQVHMQGRRCIRQVADVSPAAAAAAAAAPEEAEAATAAEPAQQPPRQSCKHIWLSLISLKLCELSPHLLQALISM